MIAVTGLDTGSIVDGHERNATPLLNDHDGDV